jgi:F0F1-type ATP synthase delta subunit
MHTIELSPQLHNVVSMLKNLNENEKSSIEETITSVFSLSNAESDAVMKTFNRKSPKDPNCSWD